MKTVEMMMMVKTSNIEGQKIPVSLRIKRRFHPLKMHCYYDYINGRMHIISLNILFDLCRFFVSVCVQYTNPHLAPGGPGLVD